jgi:hypothetical protein
MGKRTVTKERYEIMPRKINTPKVLILDDGRKVKLASQGATVIKDAGLARAIDQQYGLDKRGRRLGDVLVIPVDNDHLHAPGEAGHRFTHSIPALPWHRYDNSGQRVKE